MNIQKHFLSEHHGLGDSTMATRYLKRSIRSTVEAIFVINPKLVDFVEQLLS